MIETSPFNRSKVRSNSTDLGTHGSTKEINILQNWKTLRKRKKKSSSSSSSSKANQQTNENWPQFHPGTAFNPDPNFLSFDISISLRNRRVESTLKANFKINQAFQFGCKYHLEDQIASRLGSWLVSWLEKAVGLRCGGSGLNPAAAGNGTAIGGESKQNQSERKKGSTHFAIHLTEIPWNPWLDNCSCCRASRPSSPNVSSALFACFLLATIQIIK